MEKSGGVDARASSISLAQSITLTIGASRNRHESGMGGYDGYGIEKTLIRIRCELPSQCSLEHLLLKVLAVS